MAARQLSPHAGMVLACSEATHYQGELFLEDTSLLRVLSGELKVVQAARTHTFGPGDTLLFPRHQLATLLKRPRHGQPYKALVMRLATAPLRKYYATYPAQLGQPHTYGIVPFAPSPLLDSFFASLLPYLDLGASLPVRLADVKLEEALEILRSLRPHIDGLLSDFAEAGKINLVEFMEQNYLFNIPLAMFSHLTGRSLTTFKRDFKKAFHLSPQRWLTQRRLEQAYHLLAEHKRKPADIYYEIGFENLSHFSYAFKKRFGRAPSELAGQPGH